MNTPVYHLESNSIETHEITSVARQPVVENIVDGTQIDVIIGLGAVVGALAYVVNYFKKNQALGLSF